MNRAVAFANQSGRDSVAVTYDLTIAKIAMQLLAEEWSRYNKVFVAHGASFHMELAMFGAIGKYAVESGSEYVLNEGHVLELY